MWFIRKNCPSNVSVIIFLILFTISLYITFYRKIFPATPHAKLNQIPYVKLLEKPEIHLREKPPVTLPKVSTEINNSSIEYLDSRLDLTSNTAICQKTDYLIIYILSTITNIQRRDVIRSTWASKQSGVCFVFILGQVPGRINNAGEINIKVNNEKKSYQDIVQIDHIESYANVIYKEMAALQWSYHFYPDIPYLFKTDDDLIVDTILVSSIGKLLLTNASNDNSFLLKYRPTLIPNIILSNRTTFFRGGWAMDYQPTLRGGGKFGVSEKVWPHPVLPAYCSGFGWFMSKYIRDQLVNVSYTYPVHKTAWIGDVFISGFLAKAANVKCTGIAIDFDQTASANCSCLMVNNPMLTVCSSSFHIGGGGTEMQRHMEYRKAWNVIQLRHNFTDNIINVC
ncbi:unnamed protein product [Rotaria sp. Silwood1]|nr:unnamed protein product [Rotaria sp. Silwood1]CAF0853708.1 unnamed protein product [Rotaria sp. Silwood1]CAF3362919.1 unnamed protein product [Rotaria sp. Silwood1]CAF3377018.1 unnamed protein product [Rotaria sp. Silwood1]CAF3377995.1 unnamed protein product [Rotaria sp. Silwood1]